MANESVAIASARGFCEAPASKDEVIARAEMRIESVLPAITRAIEAGRDGMAAAQWVLEDALRELRMFPA